MLKILIIGSAAATALIKFPSLVLADDNNGWPGYANCAVASLNNRLPDSCKDISPGNYMDDYASNACLCGDEGFIFDVSKDVFNTCGCEVLEDVAHTFVEKCNGTNTPSAENEAQIIATGSGNEKGCGGHGFDKDQQIAIGVGVGLGGPVAIAAVLEILACLGVPVKKARPWPWIVRCFRKCCG